MYDSSLSNSWLQNLYQCVTYMKHVPKATHKYQFKEKKWLNSKSNICILKTRKSNMPTEDLINPQHWLNLHHIKILWIYHIKIQRETEIPVQNNRHWWFWILKLNWSIDKHLLNEISYSVRILQHLLTNYILMLVFQFSYNKKVDNATT